MNCKKASEQLIRFSMLGYLVWLMLPAVQTACRAVTGAACVGLFGLGVLLDGQTLRKQWLSLLGRAACAAIMPLFLIRFLGRGGEEAAGFYVRNAMLWFPLVYTGHVRGLKNRRLWHNVQWVLLGAVTITLLTTIGWLMEGLLRDSGSAIYSRALGNGEPGQETYLKSLMLRNIGGYDFIYAMVAALPLSCIAISHSRGRGRLAYMVLALLQLTVIFLSQYTYALLYAGVLLGAEAFAFIIRRLCRGRVKTGASLAYGLIPFALALVFAQPLLRFLVTLFQQMSFFNLAANLEALQQWLQSGVITPDSRMAHYQTALQGFAASVLVGSPRMLSYHSDVLDLLSGAGLVGAVFAGFMLWVMSRSSLRGFWRSTHRARLMMMYATLFVIAALGTVVYSSDIWVMVMLGSLFVLESPCMEAETCGQTE